MELSLFFDYLKFRNRLYAYYCIWKEMIWITYLIWFSYYMFQDKGDSVSSRRESTRKGPTIRIRVRRNKTSRE